MNKWTGLGRLTRDIDLRHTSNGTALGRFTLAVPRMKKEDGSDFISCKVWGNRAEVMEKYIKKGHKVCVAGRIETGSYEKDGHTIYTTEIVVEDFDFIEPKTTDNDGFAPVDDSYDLPY